MRPYTTFHTTSRLLLGVLITLAGTRLVMAQETADGYGGDVARFPADYEGFRDGRGPADTLVLVDNGFPNFLITGYWPPTNEMLRQWSRNADQNPGEWVGENWEGRGYNVYAFFPEFPGGTTSNPKGDGDFEVDYQDTSADWFPLLEKVRPIGITTHSRGGTSRGWKLEGGNGAYFTTYWTADYLTPYKPTSEMPIYYEPHNNQRWSSLPMQDIVDAVAAVFSTAQVDPFVSTFDESKFLSNCIGYHGNWWRDEHIDPNDPIRCYVGGHIHVGTSMEVIYATMSTEISLRVTLSHVDTLRPPVADINGDAVNDIQDFETFTSCLNGPDNAAPGGVDPLDFARADTNRDGDTDIADFRVMQIEFPGT